MKPTCETLRKMPLYLLCLTAVGVSLAASLRASALSHRMASPTPVAVVDWLKVTDNLDEWKEIQAQLQAMGDELREEGDAREAKLKEMQDGYKALPEGTEPFETERNKYLLEAMQYEAWVKFNQARLEDLKMRRQIEIYNKISAAAGEVAKQNGYWLVLWDDSSSKAPKTEDASMQQAAELISRRQVVFVDSQAPVSITDAVAQWMNNEYKAGRQ